MEIIFVPNVMPIDLPLDVYETLFLLADFDACLNLLLLSKSIKNKLYNSSRLWTLMADKYLSTPVKFPFDKQLELYNISRRQLFIETWTKGYWYYIFKSAKFDVDTYVNNKKYIVNMRFDIGDRVELLTRRHITFDFDAMQKRNPSLKYSLLLEVGFRSDQNTLSLLGERNAVAVDRISEYQSYSEMPSHFPAGNRDIFDWIYGLGVFKIETFDARFSGKIKFGGCTFAKTLYLQSNMYLAKNIVSTGKIKNRKFETDKPVSLIVTFNGKFTIRHRDTFVTMSKIRGESHNYPF